MKQNRSNLDLLSHEICLSFNVTLSLCIFYHCAGVTIVLSPVFTMARNVHLVGCGFLVKLQRSTVSTWIGISVKTAERRTAGEWHTGSGTLLLRTGLITKRYRIQTKEVAFWRLHRQCSIIFFFPGDSLKFFCTPFSSRWEEKSKNKKKNTHTYTQMKTIKIPEYSNKTASFYG